jgi:ribonuclease PH
LFYYGFHTVSQKRVAFVAPLYYISKFVAIIPKDDRKATEKGYTMTGFKRPDGRGPDALRPVKITRRYLKYPEGSCFIEIGDTKIICTASVETGVPAWLEGRGAGWVTAEYAMLPRATDERTSRSGRRPVPDSRSLEIQRLVGRALRAVTDLDSFGDHRIVIDCDVIQADGGTRTAAITGGYVALYDALLATGIRAAGGIIPLREGLSAVSVGIVNGEQLLDLCYAEDSHADVDMNVAAAESGRVVEVQATGESRPFSVKEMSSLVELALKGTNLLNRLVRQLLERDIAFIQTDI